MTDQQLIGALLRLKVETGSLACAGCGHEHNCSLQGCRILQEAVAAIQRQPRMRWIPVTERLPQNYISVLVYIPTAEPLPMVHEACIGDDGEWYSSVFYGIENEDVTHWMPLPEPPEEVHSAKM